MSATCNAICIVLTVLSWKGVASQYDSSYAFVDVKNAATNQHERFCVNYEQFKTNTNLPTTVEDATAVKMSWWGSEDGNTNVCKTETRPNMAGTVVPLNYRLENSSGPCAYPFQKQGAWRGAFQYQVDQLTQHNVSTGLFLLRRGYNFFTNWHDFLFSDFYDPDLNHSSIPLFFTYNHTLFDDMLKLSSPGQSGADLEMRFYRPPSHVFDASMLIIWILAVFSITMGGYWSGRRKISLHSKERKYLVDQEKQTSVVSQSTTTTTMDDSEGTADVERLRRTSGPRQQQPPQPATTPVNCCTIIVMLIVIVGVLMLGYYFRFVMVYIFNVLLVVGGTFAMFGCLAALVGPIPCGRCRVCKSINDLTQSVFKREVFHWDCCQQRPMWRSVFLFLLSASVTITWFIIRNNAYAFILLDIINVCLCIHVIKGLRFPSLK
uniref:Uncharacterized protein n=1 Tax=Plectus sambesii TaxID=2011161 RepID=A0A914WGI5_9BILA